MKKGIILLLVAAFIAPVSAQYRSQAKPADLVSLLNAPAEVGRAAANILGLDASRLKIHHSYQMNFMSLGGQGVSQALYLNTMVYDFKIPLQVAVQWGIAHQPFGNSHAASLLQDGPFLSAAQISYQPSKNLHFQLNYQQVPYRYHPYGSYYRNPVYGGW